VDGQPAIGAVVIDKTQLLIPVHEQCLAPDASQ
jgi:hypothetical protein